MLALKEPGDSEYYPAHWCLEVRVPSNGLVKHEFAAFASAEHPDPATRPWELTWAIAPAPLPGPHYAKFELSFDPKAYDIDITNVVLDNINNPRAGIELAILRENPGNGAGYLFATQDYPDPMVTPVFLLSDILLNRPEALLPASGKLASDFFTVPPRALGPKEPICITSFEEIPSTSETPISGTLGCWTFENAQPFQWGSDGQLSLRLLNSVFRGKIRLEVGQKVPSCNGCHANTAGQMCEIGRPPTIGP